MEPLSRFIESPTPCRVCLATQTLSVKVLPSGLATAPRVFTLHTKPTLTPCCHKGLCFIIYLDDILVLTPNMLARELKLSFVLFWFVLDYILMSPSLTFISPSNFPFLSLCRNKVDTIISLPSAKLNEIQQLAHSLLNWQPVTGHQVVSFMGRTTFCANGHAQLCKLCYMVQRGMLKNHSPTHLFFFVFLFSLCQLQSFSQLWQSLVPMWFPLPDVVITTDAMYHCMVFYFQGSGVFISFVVPGLVLCT